VTTTVPIHLTVRLLPDDGGPWPPGKVNIQYGARRGEAHQVSIAPDAGDMDLGSALRAVIARELALRDAEQGKPPESGGLRVVDE
jgi:hypothetical protein